MQIDHIDSARTAMIVVDMQNDFVAAGAPMETPAARVMVPKLAEALKACRDAGVRAIFTAHVHRRDGCDMGLFDDLHPPIANRDALDAPSRVD
jgi:nicotinamidase-related amidase